MHWLASLVDGAALVHPADSARGGRSDRPGEALAAEGHEQQLARADLDGVVGGQRRGGEEFVVVEIGETAAVAGGDVEGVTLGVVADDGVVSRG
jgi:hypothetical protein